MPAVANAVVFVKLIGGEQLPGGVIFREGLDHAAVIQHVHGIPPAVDLGPWDQHGTEIPKVGGADQRGGGDAAIEQSADSPVDGGNGAYQQISELIPSGLTGSPL